MSQLLTESTLLGLAGGAVGLLVAFWTARLILSVQPPIPVPVAIDISLDATVLGFTILLSVATGVVFGVSGLMSALAQPASLCHWRPYVWSTSLMRTFRWESPGRSWFKVHWSLRATGGIPRPAPGPSWREATAWCVSEPFRYVAVRLRRCTKRRRVQIRGPVDGIQFAT